MGRPIPTFRYVIEKEIENWKEFKRALSRKDKEIFNRIMEYCRKHIPACSQTNNPEPFRPMIISIILEQLKKLNFPEEAISKIQELIE